EGEVGPGAREDPGAPPGSGRDGAARLLPTQRYDGVIGQERPEVGGDADRPHSGPAAAVRDAERLVEVQVAHVGADVGRAAEADLGVHIGAVHVHLTAVRVHDLADLPDRLFENAGGGRVGDRKSTRLN